MRFEPTTTEFRSEALTNWALRSWVQLALRADFVQLLLFYLVGQCSHFISTIAFFSRHSCFEQNLAQGITLGAEWIDTYGIQHWRVLRSNNRKVAWVGFEPTTTEFRSDALPNWAIKSWVQLGLRGIFVQLLLFDLVVQCSHLISAMVFVSRHISCKTNLAQVITLAAECINTYGIQHCWIFRNSYRKLVWVRFEPTTMNSVQTP